MTKYHAVMLDETGCEFGATVVAANKTDAYEAFREDYPESRCVQLESPEDTAACEQALYISIERAYMEEDGYYDHDEEDDYDPDVDEWDHE